MRATFVVVEKFQESNGFQLAAARGQDDELTVDTSPIMVHVDSDVFENIAVGDRIALSLGKV